MDSIVVRIRHNVNMWEIERYRTVGPKFSKKKEKNRLGFVGLFVQHKRNAQSRRKKRRTTDTNGNVCVCCVSGCGKQRRTGQTVVEKSSVYILLSLRAAHNRSVFPSTMCHTQFTNHIHVHSQLSQNTTAAAALSRYDFWRCTKRNKTFQFEYLTLPRSQEEKPSHSFCEFAFRF